MHKLLWNFSFRFVVAGNDLQNAIDKSSVNIFHYNEVYGLSKDMVSHSTTMNSCFFLIKCENDEFLNIFFRQKKSVTTTQFNWILLVEVSGHLIIIERASAEEQLEGYWDPSQFNN